MTDRLKDLLTCAGAVLVGALLFFIGRWTAPDPPVVSETSRTVTEITLDTLLIEEPEYIYEETRDSILYFVTRIVRDTTFIRDTVWLPREVKVYEDSLYRAEVSGYMPSLDRIEIYARTKIVTTEKEKVVSIAPRNSWELGLTAGYDLNFHEGVATPAPYVGASLQYTFWRRFEIGVSAGLDLPARKDAGRPAPYVGASLQFNLWTR